jgi:hypothetical protein
VRPSIRGGVPVLSHNSHRIKGCRCPKYRADIVRIGDLVEDQQRSVIVIRQRECIGQPNLLQRRNLKHQALMRRVFRDETRQIVHFGILHRQAIRHDNLADFLPRAPQIDKAAFGIVERGINGVASVKFGIATGNGGATASVALM